MLKTTEMSAKKIWQGDDNNAYGTREETGRGDYDWEVTFVVQQRLDGDEWSDVMVNGEGGETPLTITIYGTDLQKGSDVVTFSGLPRDMQQDPTAGNCPNCGAELYQNEEMCQKCKEEQNDTV